MQPMNPDTVARLVSLVEARNAQPQASVIRDVTIRVRGPSIEWQRIWMQAQEEIARRQWAFAVAKFMALKPEGRKSWAKSY